VLEVARESAILPAGYVARTRTSLPRRTLSICMRSTTASCARPTSRAASRPRSAQDFAGSKAVSDTVLCLNVLEYLDAPDRVVASLRHVEAWRDPDRARAARSRAVWKPRRSLGHKQRFSVAGPEAASRIAKALPPSRSTYQRGRRAAVVGLQQDLYRAPHQQAGAEDFRQDGLAMAPGRWLMPWPGLSLIAWHASPLDLPLRRSRRSCFRKMSSPHAS